MAQISLFWYNFFLFWYKLYFFGTNFFFFGTNFTFLVQILPFWYKFYKFYLQLVNLLTCGTDHPFHPQGQDVRKKEGRAQVGRATTPRTLRYSKAHR